MQEITGDKAYGLVLTQGIMIAFEAYSGKC